MSNASTLPNLSAVEELHLLRTKLTRPQPHPELVFRSRLMERLSMVWEHRLTLVAAPAGFGKSTLVCTWLAQTQQPAVWVSLDTADNDPRYFWAYFLAACQQLQPAAGRVMLAMLQSPQLPPAESLVGELINELFEQEARLAIVLDDYHVISDPTIHQGITYLIDHLPDNTRLVLISRSEPPLPLPRWRARRAVQEITADDLRFRASEAAELFTRVLKLKLDLEHIQALESATEGWVAGLQLAGLSLQSAANPAAVLENFSGENRFIFDYLAQEVLQQQPKTWQAFLVKTGFLDRMNASLCAAVTGEAESQALLEKMEAANLFLVALDQQRGWYRYHHLFRDVLISYLEQTTPEAEIEALHQRASRWYHAHGDISAAINHAIAGRDWKSATGLLTAHAEQMFKRSQLIPMRQWLEAVPPEVLARQPKLAIIGVWANLATAKTEHLPASLAEIETALHARADGSPGSLEHKPAVRGALAEIAAIRASLAFNRFDLVEVLHQCELAQRYLGDDTPGGLFNNRASLTSVIHFNIGLVYEFQGQVKPARQALEQARAESLKDQNWHLYPMTISHLAQLLVLSGELREAARVYRQAIESEATIRPSPLSSTVHTGLGMLYYEWDKLDQACEHLREGIERSRSWAHWEALQAGYIGLAQAVAVQESLSAALSLYDELYQLVKDFAVQWGTGAIDASRATLLARYGETHQALDWVAQTGLIGASEIPYLREGEALSAARVLVAAGQPQEALQLAQVLLPEARDHGRQSTLLKLQILTALANWAMEARQAAVAALQAALELGQPEGYRRSFLDEGPAILEMLALVSGPQGAYATQLLATQSSVGSTPAPSQREHLAGRKTAPPSQTLLSERELEVLVLLAEGRTYQEIAEALVISVNTVKSHVKNIYTRLETRNRAEAAAQARRLNLLP